MFLFFCSIVFDVIFHNPELLLWSKTDDKSDWISWQYHWQCNHWIFEWNVGWLCGLARLGYYRFIWIIHRRTNVSIYPKKKWMRLSLSSIQISVILQNQCVIRQYEILGRTPDPITIESKQNGAFSMIMLLLLHILLEQLQFIHFSSVISFLRISPFEIRCILCVYVVEVELRYFHFS